MASKQNDMRQSCSVSGLRTGDFERPYTTWEEMNNYLTRSESENYALSHLMDIRKTRPSATNPFEIGMRLIYRLAHSSYADDGTTVELGESSFGNVTVTCNMNTLQQRWRDQRGGLYKLAGVLFVISDISLQQTNFYRKLIKKGASLLGIEQQRQTFESRVRRGSARLVAEKFVSFALNDGADQWNALVAEQNNLFTLKLRLDDSRFRLCSITTRQFYDLNFIVTGSDLHRTMNAHDSSFKNAEEKRKAVHIAKLRQREEKNKEEKQGLTPRGTGENSTVTKKTYEVCIFVILGLKDYKMDNVLYSLALYLNEHSEYEIFVVTVYDVGVRQDEHNNSRNFTTFDTWRQYLDGHQRGMTPKAAKEMAMAALNRTAPWTYLLTPVLGNELQQLFPSVQNQEDTPDMSSESVSFIHLASSLFCRGHGCSSQVQQGPELVVNSPDGGHISVPGSFGPLFRPPNQPPPGAPEVEDLPEKSPYELYTEILQEKESECVTMPLPRFGQHGIQVTSHKLDTEALLQFSSIVLEDCMSRLNIPPDFSDQTSLLFTPRRRQ